MKIYLLVLSLCFFSFGAQGGTKKKKKHRTLLKYLQTTKDGPDKVRKRFKRYGVPDTEQVQLLNDKEKGLLAFIALLPEDLYIKIFTNVTRDAFKWASLFACKRIVLDESFNGDCKKSSVIAAKLWPENYSVIHRAGEDFITSRMRDLYHEGGRQRSLVHINDNMEGMSIQTIGSLIMEDEKVHLSKDKTFYVELDSERWFPRVSSHLLFQTCWVQSFKPSILLTQYKNPHNKAYTQCVTVTLSPDDTQCVVVDGTKIHLYNLQRVNATSLNSLTVYDALWWLVEFKEFQNQLSQDLSKSIFMKVPYDSAYVLPQKLKLFLCDKACKAADQTDTYIQESLLG